MEEINEKEHDQSIRTLFKELIKKYKSENYNEEIVEVQSKINGVPTFELRFIKKGVDCTYYRILLKDNKIN